MARARPLTLLVLAALALGPVATAAEPGTALKLEIRRGVAAAAHRTSDEPALRQERAVHEPSPGFALGAALGAWINATETLDYDLKTPSGDGDDSETIHLDCYDEQLSMSHLEARREALNMTPAQVATAAAISDPLVVSGWLVRKKAPHKGCG